MTPRSGWTTRELVRGVVVDLAGVGVELRASDAIRAQAMHALLGRMPRAAAPPAIELRFDGHWQPPPGDPPDETGAELRAWYRRDALFVATDQGLSGRTWTRRARIGGYARDLTRALGNVAPPLIAALLADHDRFLLHAGAIAREGRAILLLGGSGAGKSTLVFGAIDAGWRPLSDDLILLRAAPGGGVVRGLPRALAVPREVLAADAEHLPAQDDLRQRVRLPYEDWEPEEHRVAACVLVDHGGGAATVIEPVERPEVLGNLLRAMLDRRSESVRRYFTMAACLSAGPAWRLRLCRAPAARPDGAAGALASLAF